MKIKAIVASVGMLALLGACDTMSEYGNKMSESMSEFGSSVKSAFVSDDGEGTKYVVYFKSNSTDLTGGDGITKGDLPVFLDVHGQDLGPEVTVLTVQGTEAVEVPVEFVKVEGSSFTELEGIAKLMDGEGGIAFNFDTSHDSRFFTFPVRPLPYSPGAAPEVETGLIPYTGGVLLFVPLDALEFKGIQGCVIHDPGPVLGLFQVLGEGKFKVRRQRLSHG